MKRKYILGITVLAIAILAVFQLSSNKSQLNKQQLPAKTNTTAIPVKSAIVKEQIMQVSLLKTGILIPFQESGVFVPVSATLDKVNFNLGDHVKKGQVLVVSDRHLMQLELQKSDFNVGKLNNELQIYTELLVGKAATLEKVNELRQKYNNAVNQSNQIRKQISNASIKAPISGVISQKNIEQGVIANAGANIATIVNLSKAKVQVKLTESEVYQIAQNQPVNVTTDVYPNQVFNGKISFISPQADETHNYMVEIIINNSVEYMLRSGTFVYVDFTKKSNATKLIIPREALTGSIQNPSVYVIINKKVQKKNIELGRAFGDMLEVTKGLAKGDQVVVSGQINLSEDALVSVSK